MKSRIIKRVVISIVSVVALLLIFLMVIDGTLLTKEYDISRDKFSEEKHQMTKTQFNLIKAGISAGSSHNMQPWKVKIENDKTFDLYIDREKQLIVIDKNYNQLLISQGTFIGKVKQQAETLGVKIDVEYYDINMDDAIPLVASITILNEKEDGVDVVSSSTYQGSDTEVDNIEVAIDNEFTKSNFNYTYIKGTQLKDIQHYLREGTRIESNDQEAMEELLSIFRFSKRDKNNYRYGLSLNTMKPALQMIVEPIMNYTTTADSLGKSSITAFEHRLSKEVGYVLIQKENPSNTDLVETGEILTRLTKDIKGYKVRPAVQLLEELDGMKEIRTEFQNIYGLKEEVIFIMGIQPNQNGFYESIRYMVEDIVIK